LVIAMTENVDVKDEADPEVEMAAFNLRHGNKYPYDAPDAWWEQSGDSEPPASIDWAQRAARGVVADLKGRGGIKHGFEQIDEEIRTEIIASIAQIIRLSALSKESEASGSQA
jgi:hypothetical protein